MTQVIKGNNHSEVPDLSAIMQDIAALRHDLASVTRSMTKDAAKSLTSRSDLAVRAIGHQIDEKPVISLVLAFVAGFLGGRILLR